VRRGHYRLAMTDPPAPWTWIDSSLVRRSAGQVLGIVDLGKIGTAVALRGRALGFTVGFHDPFLPNGVEPALGIERAATLDVSQKIDFGLAFYMVHEVPDKLGFFKQLRAIMNETARSLMVEPKLFHESRKEFAATTSPAEEAGFVVSRGPRLLSSWSAVLGTAALWSSVEARTGEALAAGPAEAGDADRADRGLLSVADDPQRERGRGAAGRPGASGRLVARFGNGRRRPIVRGAS
jgi:hypothetical protein